MDKKNNIKQEVSLIELHNFKDSVLAKWKMGTFSDIAIINPTKIKIRDRNFLVTFLGMEDVSERGKILQKNDRRYFEVSAGYTSFIENDILFAKITPCMENGKGAYAKGLKNGIGFGSTEFHVLRSKNDNSPGFIYQYLATKNLRTQAYNNMTGTAGQQRVPAKFFYTYLIHIPPVHDQSAIASILFLLDEVIEKTDQLIEKYKRIKQGLMQDLFRYGIDENGQIRSEKTHKFKDSPLGRIPKEWEVVTIGEIAIQISYKNIKNYPYPVLSCSKYRGLVDSLEYFQGRKIYSENLATYKIVKNGTFAYATNHIEEGSIGLQNLYDVALISPMYTVFEVSKDIDKLWLFAVLKSEKYRIIYELKTVSTVNRRGSLRWNIFSEINITLPSLSEQSRIFSVLSASDEAIEKEQSYKEKLLSLKRGLMEDLLTGKVRIPQDLIKAISDKF